MAKFLKLNGKILKNSSGKAYTEAEWPKSYYISTDSPTILKLPSGQSLAAWVPESGVYGVSFSADFNLAIVAHGVHWGTYTAYGKPVTIYIYDLPDDYLERGLTGSGNGETEALNIMAALDPVGVVQIQSSGFPKIIVTTPQKAGGYY